MNDSEVHSFEAFDLILHLILDFHVYTNVYGVTIILYFLIVGAMSLMIKFHRALRRMRMEKNHAYMMTMITR